MSSRETDRRVEIAQLIEQHRALIYKVFSSYCSDTHEQEDLIQEIILQLIKSYEKFDPLAKATTWMYKVALNVSISHYRKIKSRQKYILPMPQKLVVVDHTADETTDENIVKLRSFIQEL
ncbi:MAG: sigma-70 family RNA polymerase sigma factor, partial [Bacteroidota bacterium]